MSNTFKIKLNIADRVYPLIIKPEEEEGLRKAAKKIDLLIRQFEKSYSVRDKQDVLAMCALQFAAKTEQQDISKTYVNKDVEDTLEQLNHQLSTHI